MRKKSTRLTVCASPSGMAGWCRWREREAMAYTVVNNDIIKFCQEYQGPRFQAVLTDPPYHLTSITKRFGAEGAAPAKYGKDGAFARASKGFMGKTWDGGGIAFDPATWAAIGSLM